MEKIRLRKNGDAVASSDCTVELNLSANLPLLTLTDAFINKNIISERTVNNITDNNIMYIEHEDGSTTDFKTIFNNNSVNFNTNSLLLNAETNELVNIPFFNDVDATMFKNRPIPAYYFRYAGDDVHYNSGETLMLDKKKPVRDFIVDDSIGLPTSFTIKTISVQGMNIGSTITRARSGDLYSNIKTLDLLVINTTQLKVDTSKISFYTIYQDTIFHNRLRYIGKADVTTFYIPLL